MPADGHPPSQPPSHVAVASTRYAYLHRAWKEGDITQHHIDVSEMLSKTFVR